MKSKTLLITLISLILCIGILFTGCTTETTSQYNFDISNSFELIKSSVNEDKVQLIISGDEDLDVYMLALKDNFKEENLKFEIYVYNEEETEFNIESNNFQNLRIKIEFDTNDNFYMSNEYVIIPNIENYNKVLPFKNESAEIVDTIAICNITVNEDAKMQDILSTAKVYSEQVKKLNNGTTGVKVIINDEYKYEGNDHLILIEKIDLI